MNRKSLKVLCLTVFGIILICDLAKSQSKKDFKIRDSFVPYKLSISTDPILFNPDVTYGEVKDINNTVYKTITIGNQTWMAENLRTTKYNDGSGITKVTDGTAWAFLNKAAYCWYNNDSVTYSGTYGALYNIYSFSTDKLCPTGWHVPSDSDWTTLINSYGGINQAGAHLKESGTTHWNSLGPASDNSSGFTALPGGYRYGGGLFGFLNTAGYWWSTSMDPDIASADWCWYINYHYNIVFHYSYASEGMSVRCLKNTDPTTGVLLKENGENPSLFVYPNPFHKSTKIRYRVNEHCFVSLKVFDVMGNEVATLVNEQKPAGEYSAEWNATRLPGGMYFCRLLKGNCIEIKNLVLQ